MNLSTSFREVPSSVEMSPARLKHIYSVLCALTWRPMPAVARPKLCSSGSAWFRRICQYRYVIGVVGVGNCFCGVPSASFLCQLEDVFSDFIDRCSKHGVKADDKEVACPLVVLLQQCRSILCLHPVNVLSL